MSHIFERYFRKHGHYPNVAVDAGAQRITVTFYPGYVSIRTSSPYQAQVYITRRAAIQLVAKIIPLVRLWQKNPHEDFDVPAAMHAAYLDEMKLTQSLREEKRARRQGIEAHEARQRQRNRWLKARERAARKRT